ncbi:hypothetical protein D8O01_19800, partial [Acinetobacter baumannii]
VRKLYIDDARLRLIEAVWRKGATVTAVAPFFVQTYVVYIDRCSDVRKLYIDDARLRLIEAVWRKGATVTAVAPFFVQ